LISLKNTSYGKITAFLVFSILSANFGVLLFVLAFYLRFFSLNWHRSTTTITVCQSLLMFIGFLEDEDMNESLIFYAIKNWVSSLLSAPAFPVMAVVDAVE